MITIREEKAIKVAAPKGGFLILDKPAGPSSHEVTAWVKLLYGDKAGHAGTLDPFATGVLVIAIGKALKLLQAFATSDKEYVGLARFSRAPGAQLKKMIKEFEGEIYQTPPKESAVKKQLRTRTVRSFQLMETVGRDALFRVSCQHGTYVRNLVRDIGELMGNKAQLIELRRTRAGKYTEKDAAILQDVADSPDKWALLKPIEGIPLKRIAVGNKAVNAVCYGAKLAKPGVQAIDEGIERGELVALVTSGGQLIGIGNAAMSSDEIVNAEKGIVASPIAIVMERDLFPKWK